MTGRAFVVALVVSLVLWTILLLLVQAARGARPPTLTRADVELWDRVAQCETGRRWSASGPIYQGGLGFYWSTWDWWARELGLYRRYPDAGLAPRLVQMRVAKYGRLEHRGAWGCL